MFEQAVITHQRNPWSMVLSLIMQSAAAASVVIVSLFTIQRLPNIALPIPLPPFPSMPKAVELVPAPAGTQARGPSIPRRAFTAPSRIPPGIHDIHDDALSAVPLLPADPGIAGPGSGYVPGDALFRPDQLAAPPAPAPRRREVSQSQAIRVGGQVLEARLIRRVLPEYPPMARNMRISGKVHLMCVVGTDGTVRDLRLVDGHPLLAQAALNAVRQWVYTPTKLNGEPVEVIAPVEVNFTLSQ